MLNKLPPPPAGRTGWPWTAETDPTFYSRRADWPRISIVTPSFNQAQFIEETIRSVLLQNYPNLQYIVIDGGSSDDTVSILKKYSPWIDYWVSEKDRGQSHAINKGLVRCDGEWFNWINSDDCLLPCACKGIAESAALQETQIVAGYLRMGTSLTSGRRRFRLKLTSDLEDSIVNHLVCQPATFLRLSLVRELGGIREALHFTMDLDLWVRALCRFGPGIVHLSDQEVAFFREHSQSKTASQVPGFLTDEATVMAGLAKSVGFRSDLLGLIQHGSEQIGSWDVPGIDPVRMRVCLWERFVWGAVERNWRNRDMPRFKRCLAVYRAQRPAVLTPRQRFLQVLGLLPDWTLRTLSVFRARPLV